MHFGNTVLQCFTHVCRSFCVSPEILRASNCILSLSQLCFADKQNGPAL